jgi:hypothetical protein
MRGHLVAVVAGTALLLVAALGGIAAQDDPAPPQDTSVAGRKVGVVWAAPLLSWLRDSVEPGTRVAAPQGVVARLRLELPELRITRLGADEGARLLVLPSAGGRDPAFLGRHGLRRQAEPVAAFEGGLTVVMVNSRATAADKRARARLGRALVRETNLRLTPEAWSVLTRGGVDLQLLEGLRTLVVGHTVDVSDFPRDAATRAARAPARSADIVAVDGRLVGAPDLDLDAAARLVTAAMPHSPAVTIDPTADQPALRLTVRLAGAAE